MTDMVLKTCALALMSGYKQMATSSTASGYLRRDETAVQLLTHKCSYSLYNRASPQRHIHSSVCSACSCRRQYAPHGAVVEAVLAPRGRRQQQEVERRRHVRPAVERLIGGFEHRPDALPRRATRIPVPCNRSTSACVCVCCGVCQ